MVIFGVDFYLSTQECGPFPVWLETSDDHVSWRFYDFLFIASVDRPFTWTTWAKSWLPWQTHSAYAEAKARRAAERWARLTIEASSGRTPSAQERAREDIDGIANEEGCSIPELFLRRSLQVPRWALPPGIASAKPKVRVESFAGAA